MRKSSPILFVLVFLLSTCIFRARPAIISANPTAATIDTPIVNATEAPTAIATKTATATAISVVRRAAGGTHKIC
jgi:hypothetical protein